jgi:hypothetical protein
MQAALCLSMMLIHNAIACVTMLFDSTGLAAGLTAAGVAGMAGM